MLWFLIYTAVFQEEKIWKGQIKRIQKGSSAKIKATRVEGECWFLHTPAVGGHYAQLVFTE